MAGIVERAVKALGLAEAIVAREVRAAHSAAYCGQSPSRLLCI